jgi:RNA polymerase sigma-70 factor (ECF subfamily)
VPDTASRESALIARAKEGDIAAYEEVVELHQATAFRVAWLITRSSADAEEVAQDAFLKAFRALGRFREGAPFRPWLLQIVANEARNRRVAESRRERLALRAFAEAPGEGAAPSAEQEHVGAEERRRLIEAIGRLPERDRLAVASRYLLDLSEAEMAATLQCRPGTVKSRLSRALARLREEMEAEDE